jgi:hypothetical protein
MNRGQDYFANQGILTSNSSSITRKYNTAQLHKMGLYL